MYNVHDYSIVPSQFDLNEFEFIFGSIVFLTDYVQQKLIK